VTYTFTVSATNTIGTGPSSSPSNPVTPVATTPQPPPSTPPPPTSDGAGSSGGGGGGSSGIPPDLYVEISATSTTAPAIGSELDFAVVVSSRNVGGSSDVRLDLKLPAGYKLTRIDRDRGPGCTGTPPNLSCDVAWINASTSTRVWIFGTVGQDGEQDFTATATSLLEPEFDPRDNTATLKLPPVSTTASGPFAPPPQVLRVPKLVGSGRIGGLLRVAPGAWSTAPMRVTYRWELCMRRCVTIPSATTKTLRIIRSYAGHSIRIVATATFESVSRSTPSARIKVRPRA
jgi:hypothetical protein